MPTVLIIGGGDDPQVGRVRDEIRRRGGRVVLLDSSAFPERLALSTHNDVLRLDGRRLPKLNSVYLRGLGANPLHPDHRADLKSRPHGLFAQMEERLALVSSAILVLKSRGVPIVNDLEVNAQHSRKPYQLSLLRRAELRVPRYLASNDPDEVRAFVRTVGAAVYKPVGGGATVQPLRRSDLTRERLAALRLAPVLFQERINGVSVRVYVIGRRCVAAAEIHSTELDYRRNEGAVVPTTLRKDEVRTCVAAARACSMSFCGVDIIRCKSGHYILECNPSPMFAVFEHKTGADIAGSLAQLLLRS